jgi:hypothetical protein
VTAHLAAPGADYDKLAMATSIIAVLRHNEQKQRAKS